MRVLLSWVLMISLETVHGVLRGLFLVPTVGDLRARQIGVAVGSCIVLGAALATVGWMGARPAAGWIRIGALWTVLTLSFEFSLGTLVDLNWDRMLSDYDVTRGGFMVAGVVILFFAPYLAARWRGLVL